jgi:hypothetical protein
MSGLHDFLAEFDRICGTFSAALQNAEFHNYLTLLMIALLSWSLFGTRNDLGWSRAERLTVGRVYRSRGRARVRWHREGSGWHCKDCVFVALVLFVIWLIVGGMRGGFLWLCLVRRSYFRTLSDRIASNYAPQDLLR